MEQLPTNKTTPGRRLPPKNATIKPKKGAEVFFNKDVFAEMLPTRTAIGNAINNAVHQPMADRIHSTSKMIKNLRVADLPRHALTKEDPQDQRSKSHAFRDVVLEGWLWKNRRHITPNDHPVLLVKIKSLTLNKHVEFTKMRVGVNGCEVTQHEWQFHPVPSIEFNGPMSFSSKSKFILTEFSTSSLFSIDILTKGILRDTKTSAAGYVYLSNVIRPDHLLVDDSMFRVNLKYTDKVLLTSKNKPAGELDVELVVSYPYGRVPRSLSHKVKEINERNTQETIRQSTFEQPNESKFQPLHGNDQDESGYSIMSGYDWNDTESGMSNMSVQLGKRRQSANGFRRVVPADPSVSVERREAIIPSANGAMSPDANHNPFSIVSCEDTKLPALDHEPISVGFSPISNHHRHMKASLGQIAPALPKDDSPFRDGFVEYDRVSHQGAPNRLLQGSTSPMQPLSSTSQPVHLQPVVVQTSPTANTAVRPIPVFATPHLCRIITPTRLDIDNEIRNARPPQLSITAIEPVSVDLCEPRRLKSVSHSIYIESEAQVKQELNLLSSRRFVDKFGQVFTVVMDDRGQMVSLRRSCYELLSETGSRYQIQRCLGGSGDVWLEQETITGRAFIVHGDRVPIWLECCDIVMGDEDAVVTQIDDASSAMASSHQLVQEPSPASSHQVVQEPSPASVHQVVQEPSPASVHQLVQEPSPASSHQVVQEPSPASSHQVVQEPSPASVHQLVQEPSPASSHQVVQEPSPASSHQVVQHVARKPMRHMSISEDYSPAWPDAATSSFVSLPASKLDQGLSFTEYLDASSPITHDAGQVPESMIEAPKTGSPSLSSTSPITTEYHDATSRELLDANPFSPTRRENDANARTTKTVCHFYRSGDASSCVFGDQCQFEHHQ